jgi:hypothetical protein
MTSLTPPKSCRQILMLTAGIFLLGATDGALAKNGGNANDRGKMRSDDSGRDHGDKHSEKHEEKSRNGDKSSALREVHKDKDNDKHSEKSKEKGEDKHAEKTKDKDQDKTAGTTTTSTTPAAEGDLFGKGIVGNTPTDIKQIPLDPGTGGKMPTSQAGGNVTVSNGVSTYEISNGPGGVAVYSGKDGTITATNGKESKTLNGGSVTLSGDVIGVGAAQNIQVGARNGEGKTTVAIRPQAEAKPPVPGDIGHVTTGDGSITITGQDVLKRAGQVGAVVDTAMIGPIVTPSIAAYGFVKGGAKGAYDAVGSAAKTVTKLFTGGF